MFWFGELNQFIFCMWILIFLVTLIPFRRNILWFRHGCSLWRLWAPIERRTCTIFILKISRSTLELGAAMNGFVWGLGVGIFWIDFGCWIFESCCVLIIGFICLPFFATEKFYWDSWLLGGKQVTVWVSGQALDQSHYRTFIMIVNEYINQQTNYKRGDIYKVYQLDNWDGYFII